MDKVVRTREAEFHYRDGVLHREDGPAEIYNDGSQVWLRYGEVHREDGPAIINQDGSQFWYLHDKPHRLDGPAMLWSGGYKQWKWYGEDVDTTKPHLHEGREVFLSEEPLTDIYPSARLVDGFTTWYHLDDTDATLFKLTAKDIR